ncbi:MAG: DNA-binding protein [Bdellovibrio sp. CG12_big_fil_rev_8_21_14_0_65_39_13]|nr:MAG: DNA-binding protein [Bdellovibrio sp. CG22_combo_CG10-13_8_21_14_all_39_27]PIQ59243.1 MAG: DNA-binding protein [Bdellovibrio sp. CG12_big_fil_rev_8_21_14_0_65_39_13]PIR32254.1 MAG: DNA-binding protein [Bdellovibrio sp. CG11_big_fil_rev_8_21_14_0_20_39_38]
MQFPIEQIQNMIYVIRGLRVMLDSDLARLYGVETGALNRQVKRNQNRFPEDFMFQMTFQEYEVLRCQIGISNEGKGGRRYQPLVFTENGVAMLSSVLGSKTAIQVNIAIMRIFTKLRSFHLLENNLVNEMGKLKSDTNKVFKIVFERLDDLEDQVTPKLPEKRRKIGIR